MDTPAGPAIALLILIYVVAAWFNLHIPLTGVAMRPLREDPNKSLVAICWACCPTSLAVQQAPVGRQAGPDFAVHHHAVLGASGQFALYRAGLRGAAALGYSTTQASALVGWWHRYRPSVRCLASMRMRLDNATRVSPWACSGPARGLHDLYRQSLGGRALSHSAWRFGRFSGRSPRMRCCSIAAIISWARAARLRWELTSNYVTFWPWAALCSLSTKMGLTAFGAITVFGLLVAASMVLIGIWHWNNCRRHRQRLKSCWKSPAATAGEALQLAPTSCIHYDPIASIACRANVEAFFMHSPLPCISALLLNAP